MRSRILQILFAYVVFLNSFGECENQNVFAYPMIYTTESQSVTGKWCLNDCVDGKCVVDIDAVENCHKSKSPAPTYYTTGQSYSDQYKCTSRCNVLKGDTHHRCFVDYDWNKIDYCNPDFTKSFEYRDFTFDNGPCINDCWAKSKDSDLKKGECNDISGALRGCYVDKYFYETVITINGHKCNGECRRHEGTSYSWCYYSASDWDYCARPALYNTACFKCKPEHLRDNKETVEKYAERMERDPDLVTVAVSDPNNPIYSYTYNETVTPNGIIRLPLVIRARIYRSHIQPRNSRGSNSISSDARTNCRRMGMAPRDAVGHLIAYKLGGPADFYNFVPMTQAINIGSVSGGSVYAPSVWAATEREVAHFVERDDGQVTVIVVLMYNLNDPNYPYRPIRIGWGQWERASNGDVTLSCNNYWYNNEPSAEDPDCHD